MTRLSLNDYLKVRADDTPSGTAYSFLEQPDDFTRTETLTYLGLRERVTRFSRLLRTSVAPGARAVLLYPPGIAYIVALYSCLWSGIIAVPAYSLRTNRNGKRVEAIIRDCGASTILAAPEDWPRIRESGAGASLKRNCMQLVCEPPKGGPEADAPLESIENDVAFLQYTSGSTDTPKGVVVTHSNLIHNLSEIQRKFGNDSGTRMVSWLPPYHDMGLVSAILEPLYVGFPVVLMSPFHFLQKPVRWLHWISTTRATVSGGPNFAFDLCVERVKDEELALLRLDSLKVMYNGAEPVHCLTLKRFVARFGRCGFHPRMLYPCYGLSEATLFVAGGSAGDGPIVMSKGTTIPERLEGARLDDTAEHMNDVFVGSGKALDQQEIKIVDAQSRAELPHGEEGEIWIRGPSVAKGYWRRPAESASTFGSSMATGGGPYLRTGDLGKIVGGELFVTGRIKDLIIVRGEKYHPQDIERVIEEELPPLQPSCTVAFEYRYSEDNEAKVGVVAEIRRSCRNTDRSRLPQMVFKACGQHFGLSLSAIVILRPGQTLKTSSGKIQRSLTKQRFLAGDLESWATWGDAASRHEPIAHEAARAPLRHGASLVSGRMRWIRKRDTVIVLLANIVPFLAFLYIIGGVLAGQAVHAFELALFAAGHLLAMIGLELGYHRYFAHRCFKTHKGIAYLLGILGSMSFQGGVIWWTATHRRHHAHTEREHDPHSPVMPKGSSVATRLKGLWHAHLGWMLVGERLKPLGWEQWAMDLFRDPMIFKLHMNYWKWGLVGLLVPGVLGAMWYQSANGFWVGLAWGGLLPVFVANQLMYSTNSLCHTVGTRMFERSDNSHNIALLAPVSIGLSLHNNHHAFPGAANLQFRWWQVDITAALIWALEQSGLAWDVRRASPEEVEQKRVAVARPGD